MRRIVRRIAAQVMAVAMMVAVFVGNGVTAYAYNTNQHTDLDADMLIGEDTTHEETYKAAAGESLDITGSLDISKIKTNFDSYTFMLRLWLGYKGAVHGRDLNEVYLYDGNIDSIPVGKPGIRCSFVATFNLPEGLSVSDNYSAILEENNLFEIGAVSYDANQRQMTVTMPVKKVYATFQSLKDDFDTITEGQKLTVTLTGISVADDVTVGDQYTVSGSVTGSFWTNMRVDTREGRSYTWPQFSWTGVQTADGEDSVAADGINLTVEVVDTPVEPKVVSDDEHHGCHHKYEWDVVKKGTQTEDGVMKYRCIYCGTVEYEVPIAAYFIFNKDTQQDILHAAQGATVVAKTPIFISFHEMVQEALAERPDVTLVVDYRNDGKEYEMTIPAGSGQTLDTLFAESQYAGFLYLGGAFATTEVTY